MAWSKVSRHQRGYGTEWYKLRNQVMQRDMSLCQCPLCQGGKLRVMLAQAVDHIKPKAQGGTDDMDNLRAVSHECHARLTLEQQGKRQTAPKAKFTAEGRVVW